MNKYTVPRVLSVPVVALLFAFTPGTTSALTMLTSSLDFGATGANVMSLQQFLAADASLYPEGIVSGYFGSLTRAAVQRYQCREGIVCSGDAASTGYGRVGPRTLAAINASIGGATTGDVSAPIMSPVAVATTSSSATLTWATNEPARGTIYYSTSPIAAVEGFVPVISGQVVGESAFGYNHVLNVSGLAPNTVYFYATRSDDASGNIQITWPAVFRTGL
ncbi:fibronectin type III domain-containing protein [Candidatus Kaiserbacteria bacterium]|nr:fibronectin type III domain-containing protein [Candidatus Kaiserbacteria bacterium]